MSLSALLAAVFFILLGVSWMGWVAVSTLFLGIWSFVTGIVWLIEQWHPFTLQRP